MSHEDPNYTPAAAHDFANQKLGVWNIIKETLEIIRRRAFLFFVISLVSTAAIYVFPSTIIELEIIAGIKEPDFEHVIDFIIYMSIIFLTGVLSYVVACIPVQMSYDIKFENQIKIYRYLTTIIKKGLT